MQGSTFQKRAARAAVIPAVFALGAVAAFNLRGNAGQQSNLPPVQPPAQALDIQTAFEKVADSMRPSVVFIRSRQAAPEEGRVRTNSDDGSDGQDDSPFAPNSPFGRQFRMMPGMPGMPGGQGFRMMPRRAVASGSGVIVRSDGWIMTNDHVVAGADKVTVKLQDGREFVGQVKRDFKSDLAMIKIDATGLRAAELADSDRSRVGQWAIAFGSPFGLSDTMTVGIVSSLHRRQEIGGGSDGRLYPSLIQTDASINPGNSGGPLVDIYGRVVGINVAIESPSGGNVGIGFAIPANTAKYIMDQLITRGTVQRGYLGLVPQTLTFDQQKAYGVTEGALVSVVQDNTPAAKAGFQVGDIITRYNNKPVTDEAAIRDQIMRTRPGETVPVVVRRDGREQTLNVTLGSPQDAPVAQNDAPKAPAASGKLGLRVGDASDAEVRSALKLKGDVKGVVVVEVVPGSPAEAAGIAPGDIITRLNGKTIGSPAQLSDVSKGLKDGATVPVVIRRGTQTVLAEISLE